MIVHVEAGSPAHRAGLSEGDIVLGFDQLPITGVDDLRKALSDGAIGRESQLEILRRGERRTASVTPIESPPRD